MMADSSVLERFCSKHFSPVSRSSLSMFNLTLGTETCSYSLRVMMLISVSRCRWSCQSKVCACCTGLAVHADDLPTLREAMRQSSLAHTNLDCDYR